MGKCHLCWEGKENTKIIPADLFSNDVNLTHNVTAIWHNTDIFDKITLVDFNKTFDNTDNNEQMFWEFDLKPPQVVLLMEGDWLENELDLVNNCYAESKYWDIS